MNILLVTQDFPPARGGIQTYCYELARELVRLGHRVTVICPAENVLSSDTKAKNIPMEGLSIQRFRIHSSWLFIPLIFSMPRLLRQQGATLILYAQWQSALWLLFPSRGTRPFAQVRQYVMVHGRELLTSVLGPLAPPFRRAVFRRMTAALPNSHAVAELLRRRVRPACPVHIVHPGVRPEIFSPVSTQVLKARYGLQNELVLFTLTRLVPRKNIDILISLMPSLLKREPNLRFFVGGTGPEMDKLQSLSKSLKLEGKVRFLGRIAESEMAAHYSLADIFVLPSTSSGRDVEGFGIVFLEASACGVPCIGVRDGGIPDAVADGQTGLLAEPGDIESLQGALLKLVESPQLRQEMGRRGRERVLEAFTWEHCARRYIDVMNSE